MDVFRNYYAIIPANVRYDKELSPNAKLLYAEITSLCNEKGYCWATNSYFSDLYSLSDRTIQNLLKQLSEKKYIKIELVNNTNRKIYICDTHEKNFVGVGNNFHTPYEKNFTHNNKVNNKNKNIINNIITEDVLNYDWLND